MNLSRKRKFNYVISFLFIVFFIAGFISHDFILFIFKEKGVIISDDLDFIYKKLSYLFNSVEKDDVLNSSCFYSLVFESYGLSIDIYLEGEGIIFNVSQDVYKRNDYSFFREYPNRIAELGVRYVKSGKNYCNLNNLLEQMLGHKHFLAWENWKEGRYYGDAEMIYDAIMSEL